MSNVTISGSVQLICHPDLENPVTKVIGFFVFITIVLYDIIVKKGVAFGEEVIASVGSCFFILVPVSLIALENCQNSNP